MPAEWLLIEYAAGLRCPVDVWSLQAAMPSASTTRVRSVVGVTYCLRCGTSAVSATGRTRGC